MWLSFPVTIGLLFWGSDQFIKVAVELARRYNINRMVVGMVLVGILTAIPEWLVSLFAALSGNVGIALGNAIGSYIVNIGLVLGITALIVPITIKVSSITKEFLALLLSLLLAVLVLRDHFFSRSEAILLLAALWVILVMGTLWCLRRRDATASLPEVITPAKIHQRHGGLLSLQLLFGLGLMLISSNLLINAGVELAKYFGLRLQDSNSLAASDTYAGPGSTPMLNFDSEAVSNKSHYCDMEEVRKMLPVRMINFN